MPSATDPQWPDVTQKDLTDILKGIYSQDTVFTFLILVPCFGHPKVLCIGDDVTEKKKSYKEMNECDERSLKFCRS